MKTKQCAKCEQILLLEMFSNTKTRKDGKQSECKKCCSAYSKQYYQDNKKYILLCNKKWKESRKKYVLAYAKQWKRNKYHTNLSFRLGFCFSRAIYGSLKIQKNGHQWEAFIGYTCKDLMEHLEKKFTSKMNWGNHGGYWHIDHIIPISLWKFDSYKDKEFKQCWALANLQPLEVKENLRKYNHIEEIKNNENL